MKLIAVRRTSTLKHEILKVDIDIPWDLFMEFKEHWEKTRLATLIHFNLELIDIIYQKSQNGKTHVWVHIKTPRPLTPYEKALIQFLLGDDHNRAKLNFMRAERTPNKFDSFNILFSKKIRRDRENERKDGEDVH